MKRLLNVSMSYLAALAIIGLFPTAHMPIASAVTKASFQGLGDLPGGIFKSIAHGISANGAVVSGFSESESGTQAFRWTADGGMMGLGTLVPGVVIAYSGSESGSLALNGAVVVGDSLSELGYEAFRWQDGVMVGLGDLPGGFFDSFARGVSHDGAVIVGGSNSEFGYEAFRWTPSIPCKDCRAVGTMVGLGDLPGGTFFSLATAVSADGAVIVGMGRSALGDEAFRWTASDGMIGLGDLPGGKFGSIAQAVSADGAVVVGSAGGTGETSGIEAFRWTADGGMVGLGYLPGGKGLSSTLRAVSADGSMAVGGDSGQAIIWDANNGMRSLQDVLVNDFGLDLTGWTLEIAMSVSADGLTIAGYGINPDGFNEAWIAHIPDPCPGDIDGDDVTDIDDLFTVIASWGPCPQPCPPSCAGDINDDCNVDIDDLFTVIATWGPCP